MPQVEFEGQQYDFPEDATQEEMTTALNNLPQEEEELPTEDAREPHTEEVTIKKDEGIKRNKDGSHVAYTDSEGFLTGGMGHLMTEKEKELYPKGEPIPDKVVKEWFKTDMKEADDILTGVLESKAVHVPDEVFSILLNMTFNLGEAGITEFKEMWDAIETGDWATAAAEMRDSKWAKQVGNRAVRLADRMAAVQSNVQEEEEVAQDNLVPSKGGLFKDKETGVLYVIDAEGNKTEV